MKDATSPQSLVEACPEALISPAGPLHGPPKGKQAGGGGSRDSSALVFNFLLSQSRKQWLENERCGFGKHHHHFLAEMTM